jgi:hypothetical protein
MEENVSAPVKRTRSLTPLEWEKHRETITDLYIGKNMSLPRLMEYMRTVYGFHGT